MILDCPRCGVKSVQTTRAFREPVVLREQGLHWALERCQNQACGGLLLVTLAKGAEVPLHVFPAGSFEIDPRLPVDDELRRDFREAGKCLSAGCYRASLVMSRRALQRCLRAHGCGQRNLGGADGAISAAMEQGVLRKPFHEIAEEIKEYGNLSAHPDDEQLGAASQASAEQVLQFLELIIEDLYHLPAKAAALRRQRGASGSR